MVSAMSTEELERLIRRKYHISKLARLEKVEVADYLAVFEFSNGIVVLIVFNEFDKRKKLFVFEDEPLMVIGYTKLR